MNAVGIDVSKGKSMIAVMRPFGEIVVSPFEVNHTVDELGKLAEMLRKLDGETKIVMECTGSYHLPIAYALNEAELFVSTVNPIITHNYDNNSIRKSKNDKSDAIKIANYTLTNWLKLQQFIPEEDVRHMLKVYSRQYTKYKKILTMLKNNLISLLDSTFPGANEIFTSQPRKSDGHEKWVDFVAHFWHCKCISSLSQKAFVTRYRKWCKRADYNFSQVKAEDVYIDSLGHCYVIPMTETAKLLITQATSQINTVSETINNLACEMKALAASLPEYPVVMEFRGVGDIIGPQLIAEIGDIYRYFKKSSLVRYAGLEPVENQSGKFRGGESISKQGSPHLRRTLFLVMDCLLKHAPADDPIFQFLDRKRAEGKHYRSYMCAGAAKFLRVYYARVREYLEKHYVD
jgi:transposase